MRERDGTDASWHETRLAEIRESARRLRAAGEHLQWSGEAEPERLEELRALIMEACTILWEVEGEGPFLRLPEWSAIQPEVFALPLLLIATEWAIKDLDGRPFFAGNARWWWCAEQSVRISERLGDWSSRESQAAA